MTKNNGRWKPGQSGNPKGPAVLPAELRAVTRLSAGYVKGLIAKLSQLSPEQLVVGLETNAFNAMEAMVASIIKRAIVDGDHSRLNFLLDRTVGKVVEQRIVKLEPVTYRTTIQPDGSLMQELLRDEFGDPEGEIVDVEASDAKRG